MKRHSHRKHAESGFTLIELSIVLIIIGLIVSGVLVGQDLIDNARLRSTIGQIEGYHTAVNTFKLKYNALPGDVAGGSIGLTPSKTPAAIKTNGVIEDENGTAALAIGEPTTFWLHLSEAGLIAGSYTDVEATDTTTVGINMPPAKTGVNGIGVYGIDGVNYYQIGASSGGNGTASYTDSLTPAQAFNIDSKMDNGLPNSGIVRAAGTGSAGGAPTTEMEGAQCVLTPEDDGQLTYDLASSGVYCQLRFEFM